jgi:hypothetical protein
MAQNINPIYPLIGSPSWVVLTTANTAKDGTGTVGTLSTGDTDGTFVQRIICRSLGTNVASVLRVFLNNGSTNATPANNSLVFEVSLPATTVSEVAAQAPVELAVGFVLPSGYKLNTTIGTTVAAGWAVTAITADYS